MTDISQMISLRKKVLDKEFSRMNDMQKKAVFHVDGPLLILAGAGSGKTTVLVNRIANMIEYGCAYNSDEFFGTLSDDEISAIENYLAGNGELDDKIKYHLSVKAVKPWNILAITFTNKAAGELKERIAKRIGEKSSDIWAATFHSTCARILRRYGDRIGYTSRFAIYDTDDQKRIIKDCQKILNIDEKILSCKDILASISSQKDAMITPEEFLKSAGSNSRLISIGKVYALYQKKLMEADAMDFDDLLSNTVKLLEENPDVLEYYQDKFKYIMVDEYQDTNRVQYKFVSMLAEKNNNICVVGDDDQSIYKFRGATIENILTFEQMFKNARVIRLEQNYRSTKNILNAANEVIAHNVERKGKTLWTENATGDKITIYTARSEREEAQFIVDTVKKNVANGKKYSDNAVLYRVNAQSNILEQAFVRANIPHRVIGGHRFYDREHIRDMLAYLHVISNPNDNIRLRRIVNKPKRCIGDSTLTRASEIADSLGVSIYEVISTAEKYDSLLKAVGKLNNFVSLIEKYRAVSEDKNVKLSDMYSQLLDEIEYRTYLKREKDDYDQRILDVEELKSNIIKYEQESDDPSLYGFLEEISLITDIDNYDQEADSVVLMTIHSAKGLEFPIVFIPGMEDGIFPGGQALFNGQEQLEEERRLAYVAITRAKQKLYLIKATQRILYGATKYNAPSTFLNEIPLLYLEMIEAKSFVKNQNPVMPKPKKGINYSAKQVSRISQPVAKPVISSSVSKSSYRVGDSVSHAKFGDGIVTAVDDKNLFVDVAFESVGTKKFLITDPRLTKR